MNSKLMNFNRIIKMLTYKIRKNRKKIKITFLHLSLGMKNDEKKKDFPKIWMEI